MNYHRQIDEYFGRPQSDAAADEHARQIRIQDALAKCLAVLDAEELTETLAIRLDYSFVRAAIDDVTVSAEKISDLVDDAENDAWLCAKHDADEYRYELRRDEDLS